MRILHVHDYFAPGNSRFGYDMDRLLVARGHTVHVLAGVGSMGPADGAKFEGVLFHTYPFGGDRSLLRRYVGSLRTNTERFEALHREYAYDLVVLNQPLCARGILRSKASRETARVYWFISPWAAEWEESHPGAGWFSRRLLGGLRNAMEDRALRQCDLVLVESEFVLRELRERHPGVEEGRVSLVPGAVDLEKFHPDGSREADRRRFGLGTGSVVLTVRRLVARMGVDRLIRAVAQISGVKLVVGGDGPMRGELEGLARSLGVDARFLGYVHDKDLPALYRAADLFVLPTRALEGFGLTAIEAMACGTPAMGTPVGAIPEVLGPLGLLFEDSTPEAIAAGLRKFFDSPRNGLPGRCRDHVAARYDWNEVVGRIEDLFLRVTREGSGHGRP